MQVKASKRSSAMLRTSVNSSARDIPLLALPPRPITRCFASRSDNGASEQPSGCSSSSLRHLSRSASHQLRLVPQNAASAFPVTIPSLDTFNQGQPSVGTTHRITRHDSQPHPESHRHWPGQQQASISRVVLEPLPCPSRSEVQLTDIAATTEQQLISKPSAQNICTDPSQPMVNPVNGQCQHSNPSEPCTCQLPVTQQAIHQVDQGQSTQLAQSVPQPSEVRESTDPGTLIHNPKANSTTTPSSGEPNEQPAGLSFPYKLWALALLSATYVHQATTGYSIPVMLPMVTEGLNLSDFEGAMLTSGYSYLYALALVPIGLLADKANRPMMLGIGVAAWSALTFVGGQVHSFAELFATRVGVAAAQSTQNVICFSMIPEFFPKNKSTALAFYNCAIYLGRGLIYLAFNSAREMVQREPAVIDAAAHAQIQMDAYGNILVPLDKLDLRLVQLVYTSGDMAAIRTTSPVYDLSVAAEVAKGLHDSVWRSVLHQIAIPGALLSVALWFTVRETRKLKEQKDTSTNSTKALAEGSSSNMESSSSGTYALAAVGSSGAAAVVPTCDSMQTTVAVAAATAAAVAKGTTQATATAASVVQETGKAGAANAMAGLNGIVSLLNNKSLMITTAAAALNDVASYALIAWQSTLYERVYHLEVTQYAPVLATILPLSGIIGGVGGGLLADRLALSGQRAWVTVATSLMAAPLIWWCLSAQTADVSFWALSVGFALSEAWRAPAAVMARSVVPAEQTSTAMSVYLCLRNIVGGMGPLLVAQLSQKWGLQHAMQILPPMYLFSAALFWQAEQELQRVHGTNTNNSQDQKTAEAATNMSKTESSSTVDTTVTPIDATPAASAAGNHRDSKLTTTSSQSLNNIVSVLHNPSLVSSHSMQSTQSSVNPAVASDDSVRVTGLKVADSTSATAQHTGKLVDQISFISNSQDEKHNHGHSMEQEHNSRDADERVCNLQRSASKV